MWIHTDIFLPATTTEYQVVDIHRKPAAILIPDIRRRSREPLDASDEKALGGFETTIPNIHPAIWTQMYDPTYGGVIYFPLAPTDAQVFCTANQTTSTVTISFDANGQTVVHPVTGVQASRVGIGGALLAIRWHFSDPNGDGTGIWYAVPNFMAL